MEKSTPDSGRRSLLNWFLGGSISALAASVAYPILRFVSPPRIPEAATNQVEVGPTNDPELVDNGFKIIPFGSEPVILIRTDQNDYRAFAATCTHLDCIVEYHKKEKRVWCNCHNGEYDLNGRVVAGPPPKPLDRYDVHLVEAGAGKPATIVIAKA